MDTLTCSATFRLMGVGLDPSAVSRRLNMAPDEEHRAGDQYVNRSGRRFADFSEGLWSLSSSLGTSADANDHIVTLLDRLRGRELEVRKLVALGHRADILLGVFGEGLGNFGFALRSQTLKRLVDLSVSLEVDIYGS